MFVFFMYDLRFQTEPSCMAEFREIEGMYGVG